MLQLQLAAPVKGQPQLRFSPPTGRSFTIEYAEALSTGQWHRLADIEAQPYPRDLGFDLDAAGSRFLPGGDSPPTLTLGWGRFLESANSLGSDRVFPVPSVSLVLLLKESLSGARRRGKKRTALNEFDPGNEGLRRASLGNKLELARRTQSGYVGSRCSRNVSLAAGALFRLGFAPRWWVTLTAPSGVCWPSWADAGRCGPRCWPRARS